jgi:deoxyribodipyrimidine photo-lyase
VHSSCSTTFWAASNGTTTRAFPGPQGPQLPRTAPAFWHHFAIRALARTAHARACWRQPGATIWLSELIWRDFYFQILHHHPHVVERSFKPAYDAIAWESGPEAERLVCRLVRGPHGLPAGGCGYGADQPDGLHAQPAAHGGGQLSCEGHLGIDWRWGEATLPQNLNDFDLAANNGGWQWASSSGCDAQPYFRIFNPVSQSRKVRPEGQASFGAICRQLGKPARRSAACPMAARPLELQAAGVVLGRTTPHPVVDHDQCRCARCSAMPWSRPGEVGSCLGRRRARCGSLGSLVAHVHPFHPSDAPEARRMRKAMSVRLSAWATASAGQ